VRAEDPIRLDNLSTLKHAFILSNEVMDLTDERLQSPLKWRLRRRGRQSHGRHERARGAGQSSRIQRISQRTGVHIIASTGLYTEDSWSERFKVMSLNDYTKYMLAEIEGGIEGTSIRAGHIKDGRHRYHHFPGQTFLRAAADRIESRSAGFQPNRSLPVVAPSPGRVRERAACGEADDRRGIDPGRAVIAHNELFFVPQDIRTLVTNPVSWKLNLDCAKELLDRASTSPSIRSAWLRRRAVGYPGHQRLAAAGWPGRVNPGGVFLPARTGTDIFLKILTAEAEGKAIAGSPISSSHSSIRRHLRDRNPRANLDNPARILSH